MTEYARLMTAIIKKEIPIIGMELALKIARSVPGLQVDNSGNVISVATKIQLQILVDLYKQVSGDISILFAKKAIKQLLTGKEDLPNELKS